MIVVITINVIYIICTEFCFTETKGGADNFIITNLKLQCVRLWCPRAGLFNFVRLSWSLGLVISTVCDNTHVQRVIQKSSCFQSIEHRHIALTVCLFFSDMTVGSDNRAYKNTEGKSRSEKRLLTVTLSCAGLTLTVESCVLLRYYVWKQRAHSAVSLIFTVLFNKTK